MAIVTWLLILFIAQSPDFTEQSQPIENERCALAKATLFVIREYLSKLTTTIVITEESVNRENAKVHKFLLDYILGHLEEKVAVQISSGQNRIQPWNFYVFIIDSVEVIRKVGEKFKTDFHERRYFYLIVLTEFNQNFYNVMEEIFKLCYKFHVMNASLMVDHPDLGVCIFTYTLFSETKCRVVQPTLYFRFNEGFDQLKTIFPQKLTNFYMCPFRVTGRIVEPLLIFFGNFTGSSQTGNFDNLSGIDGKIIKILASTLNFTIQLVSFPTERTYTHNGTAYGCYAELLNGRADVAIGGFSSSDPNRWFVSPSVLYNSSPFVYVVHGGRLVGSLARLGMSFKYQVWIFLGAMIACGAVTIQIIRFVGFFAREFVFGKRNDGPTTNFVAVTLGYPITRIPRRNFARYLLGLWLLITLVFRNAYQGSLYDAFRMQKFARIPSGMDDLIKWNFEFLISFETSQLNFSPENRTIAVNMGFTERFHIMENTPHKYATIVQRELYMYYMGTKSWSGSNLLMVNEVIYMNQQVALFPKNSIFLHAFNEKLKAFSYSGVTRYVSTHFTKESLWLRKAKDRGPAKSLSNERLKGMYKIYVSMLAMAVVVFGFEVLSVYSRRLRNIFELIN